MPRTVPLSAPRDNPFARYPSSRFTREENPLDEEELFLDEVSEEYSQTQTSLSNRRKKTSFIPPLPEKGRFTWPQGSDAIKVSLAPEALTMLLAGIRATTKALPC